MIIVTGATGKLGRLVIDHLLRLTPAGTIAAAVRNTAKARELAGDTAYTLTELAAEIARQSGKALVYRDLAKSEYEAALKGFGLPAPLAEVLADSDIGASRGGLFDGSRQLSGLLGRRTTRVEEVVAAAL